MVCLHVTRKRERGGGDETGREGGVGGLSHRALLGEGASCHCTCRPPVLLLSVWLGKEGEMEKSGTEGGVRGGARREPHMAGTSARNFQCISAWQTGAPLPPCTDAELGCLHDQGVRQDR